LSRGDTAPLAAALAPDATWRAVDDGPWNCESRKDILRVMKQNIDSGLTGRIEEVFEVGENRVVTAFRPQHHQEVRYMVVTVAGDRVTEMQACTDRAAALAYAGAS